MSWLFDDEKDKKEKENSKSWFDGGYGMADDGQQFYWDQHKDEGSDEPSGINIFLGGMPNDSSNNGDLHEHIVVDDNDNIAYMREAGESTPIIDSRSGRYDA